MLTSETYTHDDVRRGSFALLLALDSEPFWHKRTEAVLGAVAPHIVARALRRAADDLWGAARETTGAPIGDFARARDWLHEYANQIEGARREQE